MKYYNTTEPPTYDLKSIQVPIVLIYGQNDIIADVEVSFHYLFYVLCFIHSFYFIRAGRDEIESPTSQTGGRNFG